MTPSTFNRELINAPLRRLKFFTSPGLKKWLPTTSLTLALVIGSWMRIKLSHWGFNFDIESWAFIADIMSKNREIYQSAGRYNYGPIWAYILLALKHVTPRLTGEHYNYHTFHWVITKFLTVVDIAITLLLRRFYGLGPALFYFLCPITILITGFHGQFDNLAILFGLLSWLILRSPELRSRRGWFALSAVLMGVSLTTKHVLAFFPFWILMWPAIGSLKKRLFYAATAIGIFGASFLPWMLHPESRYWLIKMVFKFTPQGKDALFPKLVALFLPISVVDHWFGHIPVLGGIKFVWFLAMILTGVLAVRRENIGEEPKLFFFFLIAMVAFSPGATDEYLLIPVVGLSLFYRQWKTWIYVLLSTLVIAFSGNNIGTLPQYHSLFLWYSRFPFHYYHAEIWLILLLASELVSVEWRGWVVSRRVRLGSWRVSAQSG